MRKKIFVALFSVLLLSCEKQDYQEEIGNEKINFNEVFNFSSIEEIESKEKEFLKLKTDKDSSLYNDFFDAEHTDDEIFNDNFEDVIKLYHSKKIEKIKELRNDVNFVSIQSIVDEINSLRVTNIDKSNMLFEKYQHLLNKSNSGVSTKFNISFPNITNSEGVLLLNNVNINDLDDVSDDSERSGRLTGRTEFRSGVLGGQYLPYHAGIVVVLEWAIGRTQHRNDIGIRFYRPYTEYRCFFYHIPEGRTGHHFPLPAKFTPNSDAGAGFENFAHPLLGDIFFLNFPSGTGETLRNSGEKSFATIKQIGKINPSGNFSVEIPNSTLEFSFNDDDL